MWNMGHPGQFPVPVDESWVSMPVSWSTESKKTVVSAPIYRCMPSAVGAEEMCVISINPETVGATCYVGVQPQIGKGAVVLGRVRRVAACKLDVDEFSVRVDTHVHRPDRARGGEGGRLLVHDGAVQVNGEAVDRVVRIVHDVHEGVFVSRVSGAFYCFMHDKPERP